MESKMTKIMLVEDDKSLREIYGVRLLAEGYDIVSAGDGEEALAMAIKERPQLIVSDVMMPKISGFDMLDILRSTTETKDIKVIMMTALSSEEQRQRGESLGADRYLVKSQVGIEDVVRVVHETLGDAPGATPPAAPAAATTPAPTAPAAPAKPPVAVPERPATPPPTAGQPAPMPQPQQPPKAPVDEPPSAPAVPQTPSPAPAAAPLPTPMPTPEPPKPASLKDRVIQPLNDPTNKPVDINQLLDKELAKEAGIADDAIPTVLTTEQEKKAVEDQLSNFTPPAEAPKTPSTEDSSEIAISSDGTLSVPPPPPPPAAPTA